MRTLRSRTATSARASRLGDVRSVRISCCAHASGCCFSSANAASACQGGTHTVRSVGERVCGHCGRSEARSVAGRRWGHRHRGGEPGSGLGSSAQLGCLSHHGSY